MTTIHAQLIGDQAVVPRRELEQLVELASLSGQVHPEILYDDLSTYGMMKLAEQGRAVEFWSEPGEDIYSAADGEPV